MFIVLNFFKEKENKMTNIRDYEDKDFPKLENVLKASGIFYAPLDTRGIIGRKITHDPQSIIIAEKAGQLVGTVFMIYDPWVSLIYHLGVHPDHREEGIGTQLMDEAERRFHSRGIKNVTLFIEEENPKAVEFYEKRGWRVACKTSCMEKDLD